jgi:IclR family transcriptional regulator, pca regulon regulatory protein
MIRIGQVAVHSLELPAVALPHLQRLHDLGGETVNLAVLHGDQILIVQRVEGTEIIGLQLRSGSVLPAYCTSVGLVLLAGLPDEAVRARFPDTGFEPRGPKSVRSMDELLPRLAKVRAAGYAINDEELAVGHRAAAAPIVNHEQEIVAAINVSAPAARRSRSQLMKELVPVLAESARAISAELGADPVDDPYAGIRAVTE